MDKIKLYSPLKYLISQSVLDNEFDKPISYNNPNKHFKRNVYSNNNLNININSLGTTILTNPTIYLKGNNIEQINNTELKEFIGQFENDLKFDSNYFNLVGFDFNRNIYTNYLPKNYLILFRDMPKYDMTNHKGKTGKTFKNDCKEFVLYDKKIEQLKKKIVIPQSYSDKNILRLELRVKEKMKQTKNLQNINKLKDITQSNNYNNIINEYLKMYNKINKQQNNFKIRDLKEIEIPMMDIENEAILYCLNEIGMEGYFNKIEDKVNLNFLTKKQAKARQQKALSIWNEFINYSDNDKYDLLTEINTKVNDSAMALME